MSVCWVEPWWKVVLPPCDLQGYWVFAMPDLSSRSLLRYVIWYLSAWCCFRYDVCSVYEGDVTFGESLGFCIDLPSCPGVWNVLCDVNIRSVCCVCACGDLLLGDLLSVNQPQEESPFLCTVRGLAIWNDVGICPLSTSCPSARLCCTGNCCRTCDGCLNSPYRCPEGQSYPSFTACGSGCCTGGDLCPYLPSYLLLDDGWPAEGGFPGVGGWLHPWATPLESNGPFSCKCKAGQTWIKYLNYSVGYKIRNNGSAWWKFTRFGKNDCVKEFYRKTVCTYIEQILTLHTFCTATDQKI